MVNVFSAYQFRLTEEQLERLYEIIIRAYAETEKVMWGERYVRIDRRTFTRYIDQDEVLVAFIDGKVAGGIRYFHLRDNTWSFSLLGADFNQKGKGIGRALIQEVEQIVSNKGGDRVHIEVLRPEKETVEAKTIISDWYQRMGYQIVKQIPLIELYPEKEDLQLVPTVFDCYLKEL